jgi:hypothetical protein
LEKNGWLLHLVTQIGRQYSFEKQTQFSQGNNVLEAPASILHGFLLRDTYVHSSQLKGIFGTKWAFLTFENPD